MFRFNCKNINLYSKQKKHLCPKDRGAHSLLHQLCETLCDGCQQHFTGAAVDIDKTFSGGCRANQRLAGPFYGKIQTAAPGDGKIAVNLQNVIIQLDFHQFLLGTSGFQAQDTIALDSQIEEAFVAQSCRRQVRTHNSFVLQSGITGQEQTVIQDHVSAPVCGVDQQDMLVSRLQHENTRAGIVLPATTTTSW